MGIFGSDRVAEVERPDNMIGGSSVVALLLSLVVGMVALVVAWAVVDGLVRHVCGCTKRRREAGGSAGRSWEAGAGIGSPL